MIYVCEQCNKKAKCIRWYDKLKKWVCDRCYFMYV